MTKTNPRHLAMLCDIGELANLISESKDIDSFLQQAVQLVACNLNADVGSIYLHDQLHEELVLKATVGLNPTSVGRIRMKVGEGLVGWTLERMRPVCEGSASQNPHFKFFEASDEERYHSFLSVPICRAKEKIGVLVVQHKEKDYFDQADVMALRAIAAQLAGTVANARLMIDFRQPEQPATRQTTLDELRFVKGEATVQGYALAPSTRLRSGDPLQKDVPDEAFGSGLKDFQRAVQETADQLRRLQDQLVRRLPESAALIFEAHHMILKDPSFVEKIKTEIASGTSAPSAVRRMARHFIERFEAHPNPYIKEKTYDIKDLTRRLLYNMRKGKDGGQSPLDGRIVIASQIYPSDVLKLASESVAGIIMVSGGVASHVAIIARSLQIPMIIAQRKELLEIPEGTEILMDAEIGSIYVAPTEPVLQQFQQRNRVRLESAGRSMKMRSHTQTRDGMRIQLLANINLLSELDLARDLKAEGIGLYRSEFPFIVRSVFPSEEEQRRVYERLFKQMEGKPVFIRTLDVGGDKVLPYLDIPQEANPELGLRSIRFSLKYRDIFDQQIRAILRAGVHAHELGIMFPMISSIDEFDAARQAVQDALSALAAEGLAHYAQPRIGAMIELPAIGQIIDELAMKADFFSIGTNDFIQYMLAVDRTNQNVAEYYQPYHPAVLRALKNVVRGAIDNHTPISVCGEVAHHAEFIPFLIGIGIRQLSVDPQFLPLVQQAVSGLTLSESEDYAGSLLKAATQAGVNDVRAAWVKRLGE
jgi:phosphotransferase system enzyme I (PtsP)